MNSREKIIEVLKVFLMLLAGWITVYMQSFVSVAGGGVSLVFVITVPLLVGSSVLLSVLYLGLRRRMNELINIVYVSSTVFLLVAFALIMYPYAN